MRVLLQRVRTASVTVEGQQLGAIGQGLLMFVGFGAEDTDAVVDKLVDKICRLRIFADEVGKTNLSIADVAGEALIVSQFTLYADCKKGNRPSFGAACAPDEANRLYEYFITKTKAQLGAERVQTGSFGADMQVELVNDGPFTVWLDSATL